MAEKKWKGYKENFKEIKEEEAITKENFLEVIAKYQKHGEKIELEHKYYPFTASLKRVVVGYFDEEFYIDVLRDDTKLTGYWHAEHVRITNALDKCNKHPTYSGKRRPRSGCRTCMKMYEDKTGNPAVVPYKDPKVPKKKSKVREVKKAAATGVVSRKEIKKAVKAVKKNEKKSNKNNSSRVKKSKDKLEKSSPTKRRTNKKLS